MNSCQNQTLFGQNSDNLYFVCALFKDDNGSSLLSDKSTTMIISQKNMLLNVKMFVLWKKVGKFSLCRLSEQKATHLEPYTEDKQSEPSSITVKS